ncbi:hypothetical protein [Pseudomonas putida]|uniref:hypothetical protein n=1 Tax=Pseudomonas putida TaxID=303 RepID=UPI0013C50549|nr:hypothetical protein [Pseudomonas putida]
MSKQTKSDAGDGSKMQGEEERDNDAHRPDGSSGTSHDSTAQKTAREAPQKKARN